MCTALNLFNKIDRCRGKMIDILKDTYKSLFSKLTIAIWAIATVGAVLAGPFGTFYSMSLSARILYWPLVTTSSILLGYLAYALTRFLMRSGESGASSLVAGVLGTVFVTTDVYLLNKLVSTGRATDVVYLHLLGWVAFVFFSVILGRMMFLKAIAAHMTKSAPQMSPAEGLMKGSQDEALPRILDRLPRANHGAVVRLSANDHFVHIVTDAGEHPIRMRLRDAIAEMDGIEGSLVHRSHWVAHEAITQQDKGQGKVQVVLKNGDRIPVSRNYRSVLDGLNVPANQGAEAEQSSASVQ